MDNNYSNASGVGGSNSAQTSYNLASEVKKVWDDSVEGFNEIEPSKQNWRQAALPLARIKKIMKSEDEVRSERGENKLMVRIFSCFLFVGLGVK